MNTRFVPVWNLATIFPGGSASTAFATHLDQLAADIARLDQQMKHPGSGVAFWRELMRAVQTVSPALYQASAFTECLTSADVKDEKAKQLNAQVRQIGATFSAALTGLDRLLLAVPADEWEQLLADPELSAIAFPLQERRTNAAEKLAPEQEALVSALSVDGYHAWSELYDTVVGRMTIPFERDGKVEALSVGQAFNKLHDADRTVRVDLFRDWEGAWQGDAELCAAALNHLAGYRLALYKQRGWDSVLKEPLTINRMSAATLDAMWGTIARSKPPVVAYLKRKAELLGVEKLSWHDVTAPLGDSSTKVTYDQAADFILEHFGRFSPQLADFAQTAFGDRWIEAEDRPGKRPGGFCTGFPQSSQSRIFMTFSGSMDNVSTLAHELGHAFHSHVMWDLPPLVQEYAMNVAETASTFAELIVSDAAVKVANDPQERLALLEDKAGRVVAFLMNIHARFLFETRFYAARERGVLTVADLNKLMLEAQEEAFEGALGEYHPTFWASKLHFYITEVPFYNFPYTFGYLFSAGIYAQAQAQGAGFEAKYVALLRDTGRMTVEELAQLHLGVDLTQPDFWQRAVDLVLADVQEFLELTQPGASTPNEAKEN